PAAEWLLPARRAPATASRGRSGLTVRTLRAVSGRGAAFCASFVAADLLAERGTLGGGRGLLKKNANGWGWGRRLNRSHASDGVRCSELALHSVSGRSPQPTDAQCARGEELSGERDFVVGPAFCLTGWLKSRGNSARLAGRLRQPR